MAIFKMAELSYALADCSMSRFRLTEKIKTFFNIVQFYWDLLTIYNSCDLGL
jgi:hypothetical protein